MPRFSVVIPTYNRADFISKTISSVLAQAFTGFELIVVDDGSSDNTTEVVETFNDSRIRYFKQSNKERGAARNFGVSQASGEYVTFLDSDDVIYPDHLQTADEALTKFRQPPWLHCRYEIIRRSKSIPMPELGADAANKLIEGNFMSCQGVFLSREVALENPFDEDRAIAGMEDWELWLRLSARYPLVISNKITSALIDHQERSVSTGSAAKLIEKTLLFMDKVMNNKSITQKYSRSKHIFQSQCYSYIALHLALLKTEKSSAMRFLLRSVMTWPGSIWRRRFLATIKHIL
jgi:glycosyltransferase involved in cell wall biosynthesis